MTMTTATTLKLLFAPSLSLIQNYFSLSFTKYISLFPFWFCVMSLRVYAPCLPVCAFKLNSEINSYRNLISNQSISINKRWLLFGCLLFTTVRLMTFELVSTSIPKPLFDFCVILYVHSEHMCNYMKVL